MLPAGCWNDASRDGPGFRKMKGPKVEIGGYKFPISLGAENESTSRCDTAFSFLVGKERRSPSEPNRPMKNKRRAKRQWRAKRMRSRHGEKSVWRRPSSFPSHPGPKAVQSFLAKSRIWGFLLRYLTI
uniref:ORF127 protein n=1 Tax=Turritis glabra TaxID=63678 RepID=A0A5H2VCS1_TURGL|nr:ORF127 protein [Turritis glabra]